MCVKAEWIHVMATSRAPSTMSKRDIVWRHWLHFIHEANYTIPPIRPGELHVCLWIIWLFKKKLAYRTVQSYLYSLSAEIKFRGGNDILRQGFNWYIHSTMKHFMRSKGTQPIRLRRPLTIDLLNRLLVSLDLSEYNTRVYATMLTVGVYCLLRIGEICYSSLKGVVKFIRNSDIVFKSRYIEFTLWNTKTDLEKKGVKKWIVATDAKFCPFDLMCTLKVIKFNQVKPKEPFFTLKNGKPVSRYLLVKFLRDKMALVAKDIDPREWSGISLRKGGATSALRAGISGETIQSMGNWRSSVYKGYIDHGVIDISNAQCKMAKMSTTF